VTPRPGATPAWDAVGVSEDGYPEGGHLASLEPYVASVVPAVDAPAHFGSYGIAARFASSSVDAMYGADLGLRVRDRNGDLVDDGAGRSLERIDPSSAQDLIASGALQGGMLPKVRAALDAIASRPSCVVKIAPAAGAHAVLEALEQNCGTSIANVMQETK